MSKIDCTNIKNFYAERKRMCKSYGCCSECPLNKVASRLVVCQYANVDNPDKDVEIVQKWSDEHPQETMLEHFFKQHPNAPKQESGIPKVCPHEIGYTNKNGCTNYNGCINCWNRPYVEQEDKL